MRQTLGIALAACAFAALLSEGWVSAQASRTAAVGFKAAQHIEEVEGDLKGAIEAYGRLAQGTDRAIAAQALVRMAECYRKLGDDAGARGTFERVVREFADQATSAATARARLAELTRADTPATPSGVLVRQVWTGPGVDVMGGVSPDGRYVSFTDWSTGDIAIRDLASGETRRLTNKGSFLDSNDYGEGPEFSPDGSHVAYASSNEKGSYDLRIIQVTKGQAVSRSRVIYRNEESAYIEVSGWSPDGTQILVLLINRSRSNQIGFVSAADGSTRILKSLEWRYPAKVSLSPDGRYIAYDVRTRDDSSDRDIFVLASDGSREAALIEHPGIDHSPVWLPDGKKILFLSDRGGSTGAWVVEVADGKAQGPPQLVRADIGEVLPLGVARDGSYYYVARSAAGDIFTAGFDPATGSIVSPPAPAAERFLGWNLAPAWSPDGRRLAYLSQRRAVPGPGSLTVTIRAVETGEERDLSTTLSLGVADQGLVRWFPDGRSLLVSGLDGRDRWCLCRVDLQTERVTVIKPLNQHSFPSPVLSPDGKVIYYLTGGGRSIVLHDVASGEEKEFYRTPQRVEGQAALALSEDGRQFALALEGGTAGSSVRIVPTVGGDARVLVHAEAEPNAIPRFGGVAWTPEGRYILFNRNAEGMPRSAAQDIGGLWRVAVDGHEPAGRVLPAGNDVWPSIHPDGRRIAFSVRPGSSFEMWVMQNFLPRRESAQSLRP